MTSRDAQAPFALATPGDGLPPGHPPLTGDARASSSTRPASRPLAGTVKIAPDLAARLTGDVVLYVIARHHRTKAVVAVRRDDGVRFPHAFEIGAEHVMVQDQAFEGPFDLVARVSRTGDAMAAAGDLEGLTTDVPEGARGLTLLIDRVRQ